MIGFPSRHILRCVKCINRWIGSKTKELGRHIALSGNMEENFTFENEPSVLSLQTCLTWYRSDQPVAFSSRVQRQLQPHVVGTKKLIDPESRRLQRRAHDHQTVDHPRVRDFVGSLSMEVDIRSSASVFCIQKSVQDDMTPSAASTVT